MPVENVECLLCQTPAERRRTPNGYLYHCEGCGGPFEVDTGAQSRAERGEFYPHITTDMRDRIARGKRPRVELDAPYNRLVVKTMP